MKISTHNHPRYIVWLKYFLFISAIILLLELLYIDLVKYPLSRSVGSKILDILIFLSIYSVVILISAYFFGQNVTVTEEGLVIEFLWKDLMVPWDKIIEIKPAFGFLRISKNQKQIYVVLAGGLTPFHRLFGLTYGLSLKPAFIIYPTISEYQSLVETIKRHTKKN